MDGFRIAVSDCVEFMRTVDGGSVDLTVTSPPYDKMRAYRGFSWDFQATARELFRVTSDGGVVVWVVGDSTRDGSESGTSFRQALGFVDVGFKLHDTMIYVKNGTGAAGSVLGYWQTFEYMFVLVRGSRLRTFNPLGNGKRVSSGGTRHRPDRDGKTQDRPGGWRDETREGRRSNVWTYNVGNNSGDDKISVGHPARFPEALVRDHVLSWSNPGDLVMDPFLGSGTTAKVAYQTGRRFLGCDLSPEYVELTKRRLAAAWSEQVTHA